MFRLNRHDRQDWEWLIALGLGIYVVKRAESSGKGLVDALKEFLGPGLPGHPSGGPFSPGGGAFVKPDSLPYGAYMPDQGPLVEVPAVRTPYDAAGVSQLFRNALVAYGWGNVVNPTPDQWANAIAMLKAHTAAETTSTKPPYTGMPWTAVFNYNVGNIIPVGKGPYHVLQTSQGPLKFVAYNTPTQGALALVDLLGRKYGALDPAAVGDVNAYVDRLLAGGYIGPKDDPVAYRRNIVSQYNKLRPLEVSGGIVRPTLRLGSTGAAVKQWQMIIGVTPDGIFGPITESRTEEWQQVRGLDDDGVVGPKTWAVALKGPG